MTEYDLHILNNMRDTDATTVVVNRHPFKCGSVSFYTDYDVLILQIEADNLFEDLDSDKKYRISELLK